MAKHARFRADPAKIRVKVWKRDDDFHVRVQDKSNDTSFLYGIGKDPKEVVLDTLKRLSDRDGVDVDMERAYEHPFGAEGVRNRRVAQDAGLYDDVPYEDGRGGRSDRVKVRGDMRYS